jgi:hypothetical protein
VVVVPGYEGERLLLLLVGIAVAGIVYFASNRHIMIAAADPPAALGGSGEAAAADAGARRVSR